MIRNATFDFIFIKLILSVLILLTPVSVYAGNVTLTWDPPTTNTDDSPLTDLAGYKIHYGIESGNYTQSVDIGNVPEYQINNLTEGLTYYFVITAYDLSVPANESIFSNELSIFISTSDTAPPVITGVQSTDITSSTARISWTTDEASDTRIEYGPTASYGNTTTLDASMVTGHNQSLSGLQSSTLYHYRVISQDGSGNVAISGDFVFTTEAPPPLVHYYCDSDNDGYIDISTDGSCSGNGCTPAGCQTNPGDDCNDNISNVNPAAADADCDGIDNNCDGTPDDNYSPSDTSCGTGACQSTGQLICSNGSLTDTCTDGTPTGDDSDCNGIDDDCDGGVDENYVITTTTCGVGACAGNTGQFECQSGTEVNTCDPLAGALTEVCDGSSDEDCDGTVDEDCGCISGQTRPTTCGAGECGSTGIETCSGGVWGDDTCIPGTPTGDDSDCNGIDDDCDGVPDNNYVVSMQSCGTGVCASTGQLVCQNGSEVNTCVPDSPEENPEMTCDDGLDNDCNGKIDEGCSPDIKISSLLLHEDFTSGIPEAWQVQGAWNTDNPCSRSIDFPFEGNYAIVDSSCMTTGTEELETGAIDTSSCDSIELDFSSQYYWYAGSIDVDISSDGGATWSNAYGISADEGYPTPTGKNLDISSLANARDARINFTYANNETDGFWALDNVSILCRSNEVELSGGIDVTTSRTMMIANTGAAGLGIDLIEITGDDFLEFSIGENDGCSYHTLQAGETCMFDIVFTPASAGSRTAALSILSDDPDTPATNISLIGTAIDIINPAPEPEITIEDSVAPVHDLQIPFGDITEFNTSDQTITVKNDGNADLVIGSVTQSEMISTPFSTFIDTCSLQHVAPAGMCSITVRFSPDSVGNFSDIINIPSNDSDESMAAIALSGTAISSVTNNPPSRPKPKSPKNRGKGYGRKVEFKWDTSTDPDGDAVSYQLQLCEDPDLTTGCIMETALLSETVRGTYYAGMGSFSTGLLFFGIVIILPFNRQTGRRLHLFFVTTAVAGMLFLVSCGKLSDDSITSPVSNSSQNEVTLEVSDLRGSATYYWQITADDGNGGESDSDVWSFETK